MSDKEINFFETPPAIEEKNLPPPDETKAILEAVLFATDEPISLTKLQRVAPTLPPSKIGTFLKEMRQEYEASNRGFTLEEIGGGYLLRTKKEYAPFIAALSKGRKGEKLSPAASEVLAIIAYKGPITKPQIEQIRGVDSSGSVAALLERELIGEAGKMEGPGRPTLYTITPKFLQLFGLKDVGDLPSLDMKNLFGH